MKDKTLSLSDLLHVFFPETKEMDISIDKYKVLFIFDGLDECRLPLYFQKNETLQDANQKTFVDVLLTNLIVGNLLPSALIWITSRPAAADLVPSQCVHRVTEVRGFNEPQKEEYFRKKISDQSLADTIISHLKSSRSLYIMCHIPVFCWISATVLEKMLSLAETGEIPKTLTQMYTRFLIQQTNIKHEKDYEKKLTNEDMILKLGKVAFQQLMKGHLIFYDEDLRECGIDVTEASVYSGLCSQIFREELGLVQGKVFCFVHLSIQEHLAALYVHLSWTNHNRNVIEPSTKQSLWSKVKKRLQLSSSEHISFSELHQRAVKEALLIKNGHLDLFLRFLLGLSVKSHQILLQQIMTLKRSSSDSNEKTAEYIKKKIRIIDSPEKCINLFHCLNELGDRSLVEQIQQYLKSGRIKETSLSSSQWSAVVFVLLTSEEELNEFCLDKFVKGKNKAENMAVLQKLLPVIKESRSVQLADCNLTGQCCESLSSSLQLSNSLRDLDLSHNDLQNSGVKLLSDGIKSSKLNILRLADCRLTGESCTSLSSSLQSTNSHLKELDLSNNDMWDSGVKLLSDGLKSSHCQLNILRLSGCMVTEEGFCFLASALSLNPSHLRELDLSYNHPGQSLDKLLSDPNYRLEKLNVDHGGEFRIAAGLHKYACDLTLDPNTANTFLILSEEKRKATFVKEQQSYPYLPERFQYDYQVLCRESMSTRCYWEAEWSGVGAVISVTYNRICRKGQSSDGWFGRNKHSWCLICNKDRISICHSHMDTPIPVPSFSYKRVGVYLDWSAGTLVFYSISDTNTLKNLHTFKTTFTEPLYAGFGFMSYQFNSSVSLCQKPMSNNIKHA